MRPITRIKHVVDNQSVVVAGTQTGIELVKTVDAPVRANTNECETGSTVKSLYLHVECVATSSASIPNAYLNIFKNPGNNVVAPNANAVGGSDNKRFVIHEQMVMLQKQDGSNPRVLFDGVIRIPRGYQRNAPDDRLFANLFSPGINFDFCIQAIYKELR